MIVEYNRPKSLEEALILLARAEPLTFPLGGGTVLNRQSAGRIAVVDIQALGLNKLEKVGNTLKAESAVTLQKLLDTPDIPTALQTAIRHEATSNLRQVGTMAGTLVAADGFSPFTTAMLALDATLEIKSLSAGIEYVSLGNLLPLRKELLVGKLITTISVPMHVRLAYEYVARTPADLPIVCIALACWPSGRTRLALGGFGEAPILALDGPEPGGLETTARDAYAQAGDVWASAEYRSHAAATLAMRCVKALSEPDHGSHAF